MNTILNQIAYNLQNEVKNLDNCSQEYIKTHIDNLKFSINQLNGIIEKVEKYEKFALELDKQGNTLTSRMLLNFIEDLKTIELKKNYSIQYNIGKVKYVVNFHTGSKFHNDGSKFYDIRTFSNKVKMNAFIKELENNGYIQK